MRALIASGCNDSWSDGFAGDLPQPKIECWRLGQDLPVFAAERELSGLDQVWSTDITYVPLTSGFMYLAAIIDWHSRYVLAWRLSNTLDGWFCLDMLEEALSKGRPEVFNTDQGVQFTSQAWTGRVENAGVAVSMDGKGRCWTTSSWSVCGGR